MSNIRDSIKNIRREFKGEALKKSNLPQNPIKLLESWLEAAIKHEIREPNSFVLSTAFKNQPDSRVVLLRGIRDEGLVFYTNYDSRKGEEIASNPLISLNFFWREQDRQIRVKASAQKLKDMESDLYFVSRPRESQIGAWASDQSKVLENRKELEKRVKEFSEKFKGQDVPRPENWGGYFAKPFYFEFWQGRENRLHDRIIYHSPEDGNWRMDRLSP